MSTPSAVSDPPLGLVPQARPTGRSSHRYELLLAVATVLVSLGAAEGVLRVGGWRPVYERTRIRLTNGKDLGVRAGALVLDCYPSNPRGYFDIDLRDPSVRASYAAQGVGRLEEFADTFPHAVEFRYNSAGYRDVEFRPHRAGVHRIVVLGDSFTEGQGVREPDTYVRRLEKRLQAQGPDVWEVLNYGYRGQDFPSLYRLFEQAEALEPDLVIFGMVLNDPEREPTFESQWPRLNDWIMLRRPTVQPPWWQPRVVTYVDDRLESRRIAVQTTKWYQAMYTSANGGGWARTKGYLRRMRREQQAHGGDLLVALWPLLVGLEGRYPFEAEHAKVAAACTRAGIPFRDLLPVLSGRSSADLWVHPADMHPNEVAHRLVAKDLADWVLASERQP
jgi:lysophospholipase L1-like esterase